MSHHQFTILFNLRPYNNLPICILLMLSSCLKWTFITFTNCSERCWSFKDSFLVKLLRHVMSHKLTQFWSSNNHYCLVSLIIVFFIYYSTRPIMCYYKINLRVLIKIKFYYFNQLYKIMGQEWTNLKEWWKLPVV